MGGAIVLIFNVLGGGQGATIPNQDSLDWTFADSKPEWTMSGDRTEWTLSGSKLEWTFDQ